MKPKAKRFCFLGHTFNKKERSIAFNYSIEFHNRESIKFTETVFLPKNKTSLSDSEIEKFIKPVGLILGISYYKLYFPPLIKLKYRISKDEANFWNMVYRKGLGEFMFRNKLNPNKLAKFPYTRAIAKLIEVKTTKQILLGIGGGKDSIVAYELLKEFKPTLFLVETQKNDPLSDSIIEKTGEQHIKIKRKLDPKIFEHHESSYNGHIPISAIFAFLGILSAALSGHKYFVVANEHSSNFGNITYKGEIVNHQWSKSSEFEWLFQEYVRNFITRDIVYFSLIRQFYEIRVAEMFSKYKEYFGLFSSCNRNFKVSKERTKSLWCCECPKCAFVFLMLSPFVTKSELLGIFKKNLFSEKSLIPIFKDLVGLGDMKPFDCVGTFEECRVAASLASKKYGSSLVLQALIPKIKIDKKLTHTVFSTVSAPTLPTPFRFLGIKNVCILGYGKEGKITEKYITKKYPKLKIKVLDQNLDKKYLDKQKDFDLAIKTPGIPKDKVTIPYVTATNIFFSENTNFTIGITGSKGKSTTSSLIYQLIKSSGKKVSLIGNIGNPMLEVLLRKPNKNEIFVIELSSYMLDDIEYSPNIAVLLNLFPEHMDYHGSIKNYYAAKENIFKFQKNGDILIRPPFKARIPLKTTDIPLLGAHNIENIKASVEVARILKVSENTIKKVISNFKSLPHRLEFVGEFKGIKFYDDAISTTPESTIMAIHALKNIGTIFLGGQDRGYDFKKLEETIVAQKIKNIVLFPNSGDKILKSDRDFRILRTKNMEKAVDFAYTHTSKGQICLLSTASPSYSVWKNFEEKGKLFQHFVKNH